MCVCVFDRDESRIPMQNKFFSSHNLVRLIDPLNIFTLNLEKKGVLLKHKTVNM